MNYSSIMFKCAYYENAGEQEIENCIDEKSSVHDLFTSYFLLTDNVGTKSLYDEILEVEHDFLVICLKNDKQNQDNGYFVDTYNRKNIETSNGNSYSSVNDVCITSFHFSKSQIHDVSMVAHFCKYLFVFVLKEVHQIKLFYKTSHVKILLNQNSCRNKNKLKYYWKRERWKNQKNIQTMFFNNYNIKLVYPLKTARN